MAYLNVDTADLLSAAGDYTGLATCVSGLRQQVADELQRIANTHGPIGYPAALGIAAGIANAEQPVSAKANDFRMYSQRLIEHATTYTNQDADAARRMSTPRFADAHPNSGVGVGATAFTPLQRGSGAVIVWCTPTPAGFRCTNLFSDGRYVIYPSPTDRTGGWLP